MACRLHVASLPRILWSPAGSSYRLPGDGADAPFRQAPDRALCGAVTSRGCTATGDASGGVGPAWASGEFLALLSARTVRRCELEAGRAGQAVLARGSWPGSQLDVAL